MFKCNYVSGRGSKLSYLTLNFSGAFSGTGSKKQVLESVCCFTTSYFILFMRFSHDSSRVLLLVFAQVAQISSGWLILGVGSSLQ